MRQWLRSAEENSMMFIETSAEDGTKVEEAFLNLVTGQHCTYTSTVQWQLSCQQTFTRHNDYTVTAE